MSTPIFYKIRLLPNKRMPIGLFFTTLKKNIVNSYKHFRHNLKGDIHTYNLITYSESHLPKSSEPYPVHPKVKEIRERALNNYDSSLTPFNITEKQVNKINEKQP